MTTLSKTERLVAEAIEALKQQGFPEAHGFQIAQQIGKTQNTKLLIGYGTLYLALYRLLQKGIIKDRWEETPTPDNRPRRRYYRIALYETLKGGQGVKE